MYEVIYMHTIQLRSYGGGGGHDGDSQFQLHSLARSLARCLVAGLASHVDTGGGGGGGTTATGRLATGKQHLGSPLLVESNIFFHLSQNLATKGLNIADSLYKELRENKILPLKLQSGAIVA